MTVLIAAHRLVGLLLVGAAMASAAAMAAATVLGRPTNGLFRGILVGLSSIAVAEAGVGSAQYVLGRRPHDSLHLIYAVVAFLVLPMAATMARNSRRPGSAYQVGGALLLSGVFLRLAMTG